MVIGMNFIPLVLTFRKILLATRKLLLWICRAFINAGEGPVVAANSANASDAHSVNTFLDVEANVVQIVL